MPTVSESITAARAAFGSGNISTATTTIKSIKNFDDIPDAVYLLALCSAVSNNFVEAERLFRRTLALTSPTDAIYGNLGLAQLHQNKFSAAIQSFSSALEINPDYYDAIRNLASIHSHLGNNSDAAKFAEKAIRINPNDTVSINIIARASLSEGNISSAIHYFSHSLKLEPRQPDIYQALAITYINSKKYDDAEAILVKCVDYFPNNSNVLFSLGSFYESRNRLEDAMLVYEKALTLDRDNTRSIAAKARVLIAQKDFEHADAYLKEAVSLHPNSIDIATELAQYHILKREYERAYAITSGFIGLKSTQSTPPRLILIHATACRHTGRIPEAYEVLSSALDGSVAGDSEELLRYSIGDVLDHMGKYDEAFKHYSAANVIRKLPSDLEYYLAVMTDITTVIDRSFLDSAPRANNQSQLPVFIVGMPRSGTSLVEQIVSSHPDVAGAGELTDLWQIGNSISGEMNLTNYSHNLSRLTREELKRYSDQYLSALSALSNGKSRVTDKLPHNFVHIGLIELLFPNAKIIHCRRHPFDTCLSIYFNRINDNHVYARNLGELALFYSKYLELMQHWQKNSALSILTVDYEDLVRNQAHVTRMMLEHIGVEWNDKVMKYFESDRIIMTPSYHQASKEIYTSSVDRFIFY